AVAAGRPRAAGRFGAERDVLVAPLLPERADELAEGVEPVRAPVGGALHGFGRRGLGQRVLAAPEASLGLRQAQAAQRVAGGAQGRAAIAARDRARQIVAGQRLLGRAPAE